MSTPGTGTLEMRDDDSNAGGVVGSGRGRSGGGSTVLVAQR